ncbi:MAG: hypothetical protein HQL79_11280 [Magnetococcales bacterium]|nr:hypothetical protein [Magnetococcales bacterium]
MTSAEDSTILTLETIKSSLSDEIISRINRIIDQASSNNFKIRQSIFRDYLESKDFPVAGIPDRQLTFIGLLSVVYSDIGRQMSPYIREENSKKIEFICNKLEISRRLLADLSVDWAEIVNILFLFQKETKG